MTNRVLCGVHALKENDKEIYFPVAVYFKLENRKTYREAGLLRGDEGPSLDHTLDYLDEALVGMEHDEIMGVEYTEAELTNDEITLDPLCVTYPSRKLVGESIKGRVVGWHIDLKLNATRPQSPPVLIANLAWMSNSGELNYVIVDKVNIAARDEKLLTAEIHEMFVGMASYFKLGGDIKVEVVPVGKYRARYVLKDYVKPRTFMEEICHALHTSIR